MEDIVPLKESGIKRIFFHKLLLKSAEQGQEPDTEHGRYAKH